MWVRLSLRWPLNSSWAPPACGAMTTTCRHIQNTVVWSMMSRRQGLTASWPRPSTPLRCQLKVH